MPMTREMMTDMDYWPMHAVKAVCILERKLWVFNHKLQDYPCWSVVAECRSYILY